MKNLFIKAKYFIAYNLLVCKKYWNWNFVGIEYASQKSHNEENLPIEIFTHKTPLIRKLKNVDMWMQHNKVVNLHIATKKINRILIKPGETFSYWKLIGKPSRSKGYLPGMILKNGGFRTGVGGGLCQLSNLIHYMVLHSPLDITERWRHTYDVFPDENRKVPFGSGATCSYPILDLQIKNNTYQTFQFYLEVTDTELVGKIFAEKEIKERYEITEENHKMQSDLFGNFIRSNELYKNIYDKKSGKLLSKELITKNEAKMMYSPFLENGF